MSLAEIDDCGRRRWWCQVESSVGSVFVVVAQILDQNTAQVTLPKNEGLVSQLGA
jgi:hypothetical protein